MPDALSSVANGLQQQMSRLDTAAGRIARNGAGADLAGNVVDLITATRGVESNVAAARAITQTTGRLLDVFA
jgi:hypothetical protein